MKNRGSVTFGEFIKELEGDPEFQRNAMARMTRLQETLRADWIGSEPVIAELRGAGFDIQRIGDLKQLPKAEYQRATPILIRWLDRTDWHGLKAGIARTLTSRWAKPVAGPPLMRAFTSLDHPLGEQRGLETDVGTTKWAIAYALSVVADDSIFNELVDAIRDQRHGRTREMLAVALGKMKIPEAAAVLIEMLEDEDVVAHAAWALGRSKVAKAKPHLERLLMHGRPLVRRNAKKALSQIDRAAKASAPET